MAGPQCVEKGKVELNDSLFFFWLIILMDEVPLIKNPDEAEWQILVTPTHEPAWESLH